MHEHTGPSKHEEQSPELGELEREFDSQSEEIVEMSGNSSGGRSFRSTSPQPRRSIAPIGGPRRDNAIGLDVDQCEEVRVLIVEFGWIRRSLCTHCCAWMAPFGFEWVTLFERPVPLVCCCSTLASAVAPIVRGVCQLVACVYCIVLARRPLCAYQISIPMPVACELGLRQNRPQAIIAKLVWLEVPEQPRTKC